VLGGRDDLHPSVGTVLIVLGVYLITALADADGGRSRGGS
jgi:hypothetical protein